MSRFRDLLAGTGLTVEEEAAVQLEAYADLLRHYNARHNLIARTDVQHVEERHILHCLALARSRFLPGTTVVDWGTGGGLPAIPLAILFRATRFIGVDAVEKKVMTVRMMAREIGLGNLEAWHGRAESFGQAHHYSVSRATAPLAMLWGWHVRNATDAAAEGKGMWPAGLICLKGGDLMEEIAELQRNEPGLQVSKEPTGFAGAYYADKHIVTVQKGGGGKVGSGGPSL